MKSNTMKRILIVIALAMSMTAVAQTDGKLVADSSTLKRDTVDVTIAYVNDSTMKVEVSKAILIREAYRLKFVGKDGLSAATDKIALGDVKYYLKPKTKYISKDMVIWVK